jgi:flagellar motility protein MotE (MotC chaperone)
MAEKEKQAEQTLEQEHNNQSEKPGGCLHSIIAVFIAFLIVAIVFVGVFYFVAQNNINGVADSLKPHVKNYPVLKVFIPKDLKDFDPEDPKYLTDKQIEEKYQEYREKVRILNEKLDEANRAIESIKAEGQTAADLEKIAEENRLLLESIEAEKAKLEAERKSLAELIARGDTEGFKNYFQKVDKATAETIYAEIMKEAAISEEKKALAKPFSTMNPQGAANVLTELFSDDKEAALDIFEGMEPKVMAPILERMDAKIAAEIYGLLSDRRLGR